MLHHLAQLQSLLFTCCIHWTKCLSTQHNSLRYFMHLSTLKSGIRSQFCFFLFFLHLRQSVWLHSGWFVSLKCVSHRRHNCSVLLLDIEKLLTSESAGNWWRKEVRAEALVNIAFRNDSPCDTHTHTHKIKWFMKRKTDGNQRKAFLSFLLQLRSSFMSQSMKECHPQGVGWELRVTAKTWQKPRVPPPPHPLHTHTHTQPNRSFPVCYNGTKLFSLVRPSPGTSFIKRHN